MTDLIRGSRGSFDLMRHLDNDENNWVFRFLTYVPLITE